MNLRKQRKLLIDIYKTLNKLIPGYVNDIFKLRDTDRLTREKYKLTLEIPTPNQATFRSTLKSCSFPINRPGEIKNSHKPPASRNFFFCYLFS